MGKILKDDANFDRKANRVYFACGHHVDFRRGPSQEIGDWAVCRKCLQETTVVRIETDVSVPGPAKGDDYLAGLG